MESTWDPKQQRKKNETLGSQKHVFWFPTCLKKRQTVTSYTNIHGVELHIVLDQLFFYGADAWKTMFCKCFGYTWELGSPRRSGCSLSIAASRRRARIWLQFVSCSFPSTRGNLAWFSSNFLTLMTDAFVVLCGFVG